MAQQATFDNLFCFRHGPPGPLHQEYLVVVGMRTCSSQGVYQFYGHCHFIRGQQVSQPAGNERFPMCLYGPPKYLSPLERSREWARLNDLDHWKDGILQPDGQTVRYIWPSTGQHIDTKLHPDFIDAAENRILDLEYFYQEKNVVIEKHTPLHSAVSVLYLKKLERDTARKLDSIREELEKIEIDNTRTEIERQKIAEDEQFIASVFRHASEVSEVYNRTYGSDE